MIPPSKAENSQRFLKAAYGLHVSLELIEDTLANQGFEYGTHILLLAAQSRAAEAGSREDAGA